ncbi:MAG: valine--tRNA ligase, partial [Clostridia bacterium]|nr:valine--tRNA ligase [Clostridia bacterium]
EYTAELDFAADEADMEHIMDAIRAVRNRRAEMNIAPSKQAALTIVSANTAIYEKGEAYIKRLAYASSLTVTTEHPASTDGLVTIVTGDATLYLPLAELVDFKAERARLEKELKKAEGGLAGIEAKLSNEKFLAKAPENIVASEKERADKFRALIANLKESLAKLG